MKAAFMGFVYKPVVFFLAHFGWKLARGLQGLTEEILAAGSGPAN